MIWRLRRWPLFSRLLQKKFPLNMSQNVLEVISVLGDLGETLEEELEKAPRAPKIHHVFRPSKSS